MTPTEGDIQRSLGRIEGKLDGIRADLARGDRRAEELDARVTKLEHRGMYVSGGAAGVGGLLAVIGQYLWERLFA